MQRTARETNQQFIHVRGAFFDGLKHYFQTHPSAFDLRAMEAVTCALLEGSRAESELSNDSRTTRMSPHEGRKLAHMSCTLSVAVTTFPEVPDLNDQE
jgi:hypothetical protein